MNNTWCRPALDDMPAAFFRHSTTGALIYVNQSLCTALGFGPEQLIGRSVFGLAAPDGRNALLQIIATLTPEDPVRIHEQAVLSADGTVRWQQWVHRAVYNPAGDLLEYHTVGLDSTERHVVEQQLRASLSESEGLMRELHHRIKNNMQLVSNLLALQADQAEDVTVRQMLEASQARVHSMALIHHQLSRTHDLSQVDLAAYLSELVGHLRQAHLAVAPAVGWEVDTHQITLSADDAVPCGLIVNELASNALKYAFPGGREGVIRISLRDDDGRLVLEVSDNGIGLSPELDISATETMGLQLVRMLVRQLGGGLTVQTDGGTTVRVDFDRPRSART